jgi:hypothetical protein
MPTIAAMRLDPSQLIGGMAKKACAAAGSDPAEGEPKPQRKGAGKLI